MTGRNYVITFKETNKVIREIFHIELKKNDIPPFVAKGDKKRKDIAKLFGMLRYKNGAEIGVQKGWNAKTLVLNIPGVKLICVDPWERRSDLKRCQERLKDYNVEYIKMTSMEAVRDIPDGSLDFVYIDALHEFDPVMMDIICWSKKVRPGGIVSGHDYFVGQFGVVPAVNAYVNAHNIREWYITHRGQSWFWVQREEYL